MSGTRKSRFSIVYMALPVIIVVFAFAVDARAAYPDTVLADHPLGYWRLGESSFSTAFDASGNGFNGVYHSAVSLGVPGAIEGDSNTAISLNGTSESFVDLGIHSAFNHLANNFTVEAWIRNGSGRIIDTRNLSTGASGWGFSTGGFGELVFTTYGHQDFYYSGTHLIPNQWNQVAVTFDSSNDARFYVNGAFIASIQGNAPATPNSNPLFIGKEPNGTGGQYVGAVDEVAVFGSVLSAEQIKAQYLAAVPEPSTLILAALGVIALLLCRRP